MNNRKLRIIGVPLDLGAGHRGVDMGPSAIRITNLHTRLRSLGWEVNDHGDIRTSVFESVPQGTDKKQKHAETILAVNKLLADAVRQSFDGGEFPLVLGGDHSLAIGSVAGASSYFAKQNKQIGLIWIDAHADMNTPQTTPSGNIHGMSLAINLGDGDDRFISIGNATPKVKPENVAIVAARDLDRGEVAALENKGIKAFTMRTIDENGMAAVMKHAIDIASRNTAGVYVSYDMDSLDPSIAPGTGTPVPGGLTYREAHLAMEMLHDAGCVIGLDIVETNPALDIRNQTAKAATDLILSLFGKRIMKS